MTFYPALAAVAWFAGGLSSAAPATPAVPASAAPRYVQAASGNSLTFTFQQLDAASTGQFKAFRTELAYDPADLAASSLRVTVDIASLDTQDGERDAALKSADLFDTGKYPAATYVASSLARTASGGIEAVGKLTLRGVSRDLRLPLTLKPAGGGFELSGQTAIRRLEFGVGQGEWQSTESVGDEVKIQYRVTLLPAK